jgi:hypothetical protein
VQSIIQTFLIKVDHMELSDEENFFRNNFLPIFVAAKSLVLEVSPEAQQQLAQIPKTRWFAGLILGHNFMGRKKEYLQI